MKILFQVEKENDKVIDVKVLFPNEDTYYHSTGLDTIQKCLKNIVEKLNTDKNRSISFPALYAGNYKFSDTFYNHTFSILVRIKNGIPDEILSVRENSYDLSDSRDLLNKENKDKSISYKIFEVRGELK